MAPSISFIFLVPSLPHLSAECWVLSLSQPLARCLSSKRHLTFAAYPKQFWLYTYALVLRVALRAYIRFNPAINTVIAHTEQWNFGKQKEMKEKHGLTESRHCSIIFFFPTLSVPMIKNLKRILAKITASLYLSLAQRQRTQTQIWNTGIVHTTYTCQNVRAQRQATATEKVQRISVTTQLYTENIDSNWKIICSIPTERPKHVGKCARARIASTMSVRSHSNGYSLVSHFFLLLFSLNWCVHPFQASVAEIHSSHSDTQATHWSLRSEVLAHTHTHTTTTVRRSLLLFLLFIWRLPVNYYRVASCNIDVSTPRFVVGFCICTSLRNAFYFYYSSSHFSSFMNGKHWKHWKHLNFPPSF